MKKAYLVVLALTMFAALSSCAEEDEGSDISAFSQTSLDEGHDGGDAGRLDAGDARIPDASRDGSTDATIYLPLIQK